MARTAAFSPWFCSRVGSPRPGIDFPRAVRSDEDFSVGLGLRLVLPPGFWPLLFLPRGFFHWPLDLAPQDSASIYSVSVLLRELAPLGPRLRQEFPSDREE